MKLLFRGFWAVSLLAFGLLSMPQRLTGEVKSGIPAGTNLIELRNSPRVISSGVSRENRENGSFWIDMSVDLHVCTPIPRDKLLAVLMDFDNYHRVFKRITAASLGHDEYGMYRSLQLSVGLLGLTFNTNYTLLFQEAGNTADVYYLTFSHVDDDGTVKDVHGFWYFESLVLLGEPYTYVRYYSSSRVLRKFPLQRMIMSMFNGQENIDMVNQLLRAAARK
ncbi:MAG: hypothetical protein LBQ38_10645 [Spirochaetaceae bacterium]|jgi:hypothetical protein|nr:hypothetical protein [Spirochaetaceae bacterium]